MEVGTRHSTRPRRYQGDASCPLKGIFSTQLKSQTSTKSPTNVHSNQRPANVTKPKSTEFDNIRLPNIDQEAKVNDARLNLLPPMVAQRSTAHHTLMDDRDTDQQQIGGVNLAMQRSSPDPAMFAFDPEMRDQDEHEWAQYEEARKEYLNRPQTGVPQQLMDSPVDDTDHESTYSQIVEQSPLIRPF